MTRKWAMTRVSPGDYLLPSNSGRKLIRLTKYQEDGSASYGDTNRPIVGTFWQVAVIDMPATVDPYDLEDWSNWPAWDSMLPTRAAALASVSSIVEDENVKA